MEFSEITSMIALVISLISVASSIYFQVRRLAKIKAVSKYFPPSHDEDEGIYDPSLLVQVSNKDQGNKFIENLYVGYKGERGMSIVDTSTWVTDEQGHFLIAEGKNLVHEFNPDNDTILRNRDGKPATRLMAKDLADEKYWVRGARKNLKAYLKAAKGF